jgi:hypothetical protein
MFKLAGVELKKHKETKNKLAQQTQAILTQASKLNTGTA